ncbi:MAG: S8 family serine peptidase, partial [Hyphomicrobium sp.]
LIVAGLTADNIAALQQQGFAIAATRQSPTLGVSVSRIEPPARFGTTTALRRIRELAPGATAARNDSFQRSTIGPYKPMGEACGAGCVAFVMTGWKPNYLKCRLPEAIGVIDTGVDPAHPSLAGADIEVATVRRQDRRPSDPAHGTGVVSLLVGQPGSDVVGVVPRAKVIAVDAFHDAGKSDATDAYDLVAALDVLAERKVRVINLSLAGPENPVLAAAVAQLVERGTTLIAAAGPSSGQSRGYPAKYPGVIAVSAIDGDLRPSRLSARGNHIAYAGPGVGMSVASPGGKARLATGTSFAAPIVSAAFASAKSEAGGDTVRTLEKLQSTAKDLGAPGRDPVYGWGLVQFPSLGGC